MGESCTVDLDTAHDWHRLSCLIAEKGGVALWFEPQTLRLRRMELYTTNGTALKRMDLADYRPVGDQTFPFEVALSDFQSQQQASILYERVELNPHAADSIFTLASITGVREVDADAFTP